MGKLYNIWEVLDGNFPNKALAFFKGGLNEFYERYFCRRYDRGARRINRIAKSYISRQIRHGRPFYMFINYMECHSIYNPPEPYRSIYLPSGIDKQKVDQVASLSVWKHIMGRDKLGGWEFEILRALYDGELTYTDYRIAELYDFLKAMEILDDTLLIITSDHGDELGEHNLFGHGLCLYDTILRVPLIIRYPRIFGKQAMAKEQVQLLDIFPTILDMLGLDDDIKGVDGQSLLRKPSREFVVAELVDFLPNLDRLKQRFPSSDWYHFDKYNRSLKAIRTNQYKLIGVSNDKNELYNLKRDPGELSNVIDLEEEIANRLKSEMEDCKYFHESIGRSQQIIDEKTRRRLRDLGYIE